MSFLVELRAFLTAPVPRPELGMLAQIWGDRRTRLFYSFALAFSLCFSLLFYQQAFSAELIIQDDARQHVFWMQRFVDPELFPNDLIADYFQSVAPAGYSGVYRLAAALGLDPLLFSKLLPLGLSLIAVSYCFGLSLTLFPVPAAAFSSALLLAQSLCFTDTLVSGIQKSFIYPLLFAFLYYLARRRWLGTLLSILLLGSFYPQMVLIAAGTLGLQLLVLKRTKSGPGWPWNWRLGWTGDRQTWRISCLGLGTAFAVLLPYALGGSDYGPVVTPEQARQMPEFFKGGRARYFRDSDPWKFWTSGRSGIRLDSALTPATNALGMVLPLLLRLRRAFPLASQLRSSVGLMPRFLLSSGCMFLAAHALLFRLHLPSRYTGHSLRATLSLLGGIALVILLDGVWNWCQAGASSGVRRAVTGGVTVLLGGLLLLYPLTVEQFPMWSYDRAYNRELYSFLQSQPKDSLIATLSWEGDNLPTLAQRSVLVASEYAIPYHSGYYGPFRERMLALIEAQYSPYPAVVQAFIERYGVDFWLLDGDAFWPDYFEERGGLGQFQPVASVAYEHLLAGDAWLHRAEPADCVAFETRHLQVLESRCLLKQLSAAPSGSAAPSDSAAPSGSATPSGPAQ